MKKWTALAIGLAALVVGPALAKETPKSLLAKLPAKSGAFTKGAITVFPEKELGAGVSYQGAGCVVDFYVYDQGVKKIAAGVVAPVIAQSWEMAKNDLIEYMKSSGSYRDLVLEKEETVRLEVGTSALDAFYTCFKGEVAAGKDTYFPCYTEIYITGFRDHICKVRVTRARETDPAAARDLFAALLASL